MHCSRQHYLRFLLTLHHNLRLISLRHERLLQRYSGRQRPELLRIRNLQHRVKNQVQLNLHRLHPDQLHHLDLIQKHLVQLHHHLPLRQNIQPKLSPHIDQRRDKINLPKNFMMIDYSQKWSLITISFIYFLLGSDFVEKGECWLGVPSAGYQPLEPATMAARVCFDEFDVGVLFHEFVRDVLD